MLNFPYPGQRLRADAAAALVDEVNRNHLVAGPGIALRRTPAGTVISAAVAPAGGGGGGGKHPWRVRYHEPPPEVEGGTAPDPQWEVYLPAGTLTIGSSCYVINKPATSTTGHTSDTGDDGWYILPLAEGSSGEKLFHIVAHGKANVKMASGSGGAYSNAAPFVLVAAEEVAGGDEAQHHPMENFTLKKHYAGDVWNAVIATVTIKTETVDNETETTRQVRQTATAAVNVPAATPRYFRPLWQLSYDGSGQDILDTDSVTLENRTIYVGGVATEVADTDLSDDGDVYIYLTIDTSGAEPEAELSKKNATDTQPASTATSQPVMIFTMSANRVTADLRDNLSNLPYYRGIA